MAPVTGIPARRTVALVLMTISDTAANSLYRQITIGTCRAWRRATGHSAGGTETHRHAEEHGLKWIAATSPPDVRCCLAPVVVLHDGRPAAGPGLDERRIAVVDLCQPNDPIDLVTLVKLRFGDEPVNSVTLVELWFADAPIDFSVAARPIW